MFGLDWLKKYVPGIRRNMIQIYMIRVFDPQKTWIYMFWMFSYNSRYWLLLIWTSRFVFYNSKKSCCLHHRFLTFSTGWNLHYHSFANVVVFVFGSALGKLFGAISSVGHWTNGCWLHHHKHAKMQMWTQNILHMQNWLVKCLHTVWGNQHFWVPKLLSWHVIHVESIDPMNSIRYKLEQLAMKWCTFQSRSLFPIPQHEIKTKVHVMQTLVFISLLGAFVEVSFFFPPRDNVVHPTWIIPSTSQWDVRCAWWTMTWQSQNHIPSPMIYQKRIFSS